MRYKPLLIVFLLCRQALAQPPQIEPHFTGIAAVVVHEIDNAQKSIRVQAYGFTSAKIAKALLEAHKRGIHVEVILDKSNRTANYSSATLLSNVGIPVLIDAEHPIAHSKIMLIDDGVVLTGSFNFTTRAERNAENLLVIRDKALAAKYLATWTEHAGHSKPFVLPAPAAAQPAAAQPAAPVAPAAPAAAR
jgi:phosphatidylserine/phosphatidylglycerophosphate/cardiolipin synthase-like enzyme